MKSPIMEFQSKEQMYACLKEWQERLFLNDWIIKISLADPSDMKLEEVSGETEKLCYSCLETRTLWKENPEVLCGVDSHSRVASL